MTTQLLESSQRLAQQRGLKGGDHIYVKCLGGLYTHHGVYCGDGKVVHYDSSWKKIRFKDEVRETTLAEFVGPKGRRLYIVRYERPDRPEKIIARARRRLGERRYHLVRNNCEHFATWCVTRTSESTQVERVLRHVGRTVIMHATSQFRFDPAESVTPSTIGLR